RSNDRAGHLGSQRARGAGNDHLRAGPRLLGDTRVRDATGRDPRVQDVLLGAAVSMPVSARVADPVVVLAAGVVTPIGTDLDTFWSALLEGRDGVSAIERFRVDDLRVGRGGEIKRVPVVHGAG